MYKTDSSTKSRPGRGGQQKPKGQTEESDAEVEVSLKGEKRRGQRASEARQEGDRAVEIKSTERESQVDLIWKKKPRWTEAPDGRVGLVSKTESDPQAGPEPQARVQSSSASGGQTNIL